MDEYNALLQQEASQQTAFNQIKTQVDIANKQAQISSGGNAVMNAGIVMTALPKAMNSAGMLFNAFTAPRDLSVMSNQMFSSLKALNPTKTASELIGKDTAQRISNLTDLLRKNPDASLAKANIDSAIKAGSSETRANSLLSDFNLKYASDLSKGGIDGTISDPVEFNIAERMRSVLNGYDSYVRGSRNLAGNDAEEAVNKVSSRMKDILEARFNTLRTTNKPINLDDESELGKVARNTYNKVRSYAEEIYNRVKGGYSRLTDADITAETGQGTGTEMGSIERMAQSMLLRRPDTEVLNSTLQRIVPRNTEGATPSETLEMNSLEQIDEEAPIAVRSIAPNPASSTTSSEAPEAIGSQELQFPQASEVGTTTFTETNVMNVESNVSPADVQASGLSRMTEAPQSLQALASRTSRTITAEPEGVGVTTEASEALSAGAGAEEATATEIAGEAGAGVAEGVGEALSLAGGPIGLLLGLGGFAYSIYQALSGELTPQPAIATPVAPQFNPIKSETPASSLHF